MPRTDITPENRVADFDKFPKLLATRDQERFRIWCAEGDPRTGKVSPWSEWVHVMKAPVFLAGQPVMEERENRDGSKTEGPKLEFIGQPICLGDYSTLADHGLDPAHCPVCESAERGAARPPEIRYAMNIIKYAIRAGGWELAVPFSAEVLMWAFPASRFSKLVDIQGDAGPLLTYDLLLGPVERPARFQKYEIKASTQGVAWRALAKSSPPVAEYIKALWTTPGNRATDEQLQAGCGRKVVNRNYLLSDLRTYERRWAQYNSTEDSIPTPGQVAPQGAGVAAGLDDLINSVGGQAAANGSPAPAADATDAAQGGPVEDWLATPTAKSGSPAVDAYRAEATAVADLVAEEEAQLEAVRAAKAEAQQAVQDIVSPDPLAEPEAAEAAQTDPTAGPVATTGAEATAESPAGPQPGAAMSWDDMLDALK